MANIYKIKGNLYALRGKLVKMDARNPMIIYINTTLGNGFNSFTLPLTNHRTNLKVKTSDGQDFTITNYLDSARTINFPTAGGYSMEIRGECGWSFNNTGDCQKVTSVDKLGTVKFNYAEAAFYGCRNMTYFDEGAVINAPYTNSLASFLRSTLALTSGIPPKLLHNCRNTRTFDTFFRDSGVQGSIPVDFLRYVTRATSLTQFFSQSKIYGAIPADLLKYVINVRSLDSFFGGCSGLTGSIPADLLRYVINVTNLAGFFSGCINLTGNIPADLLRYVINVAGLSSFFYGCNRLTGSIPPDLLKYVTNVVNLDYFFFGCSGLTGSIPADILRYVINATNIGRFFYGCSKLTGSIPVDLLRYVVNVVNIQTFMYGCYGLSGNIPTDLLMYVTKVTDLRYFFYNCRNLNVVGDFINPSIIPNVNVWDYFMEVSSTAYSHTGTMQDVWANAKPTATKLRAFRNCTAFANYGDIPTTWK